MTTDEAECPTHVFNLPVSKSRLAYKGSSPWKEEDKHLIGHDVAGNVSIEVEVLFPNAFYNFFMMTF